MSELKKTITDAMRIHIEENAQYRNCSESYMDKLLVDLVTRDMQDKLNKKRKQGYGGWWAEELCSTEDLLERLRGHIEKGDMVDVMNFAAMIHARKLLERKGDE